MERTEEENFSREMHKAVCSECGQECEVPFKPTEGKRVLCNDCFSASKPNRRPRFRRNDNFGRFKFKTTCSECGQECEVPFKPTEGREVFCNDCFRKKKPQEE